MNTPMTERAWRRNYMNDDAKEVQYKLRRSLFWIVSSNVHKSLRTHVRMTKRLPLVTGLTLTIEKAE